MTTPISPLPAFPTGLPALSTPASPPAPAGFGELLQRSLAEVDRLQMVAQQSVQRSLTADDLPLVETFSAVREADLALRLLLQVRNKLIDAYQELQQMRF